MKVKWVQRDKISALFTDVEIVLGKEIYPLRTTQEETEKTK